MRFLNNLHLNIKSIIIISIIILFIFYISLISILKLNDIYINKITDLYFLKKTDLNLNKIFNKEKSFKYLDIKSEDNIKIEFPYYNNLIYQTTKLNEFNSYIFGLKRKNKRNSIFIISFIFVFVVITGFLLILIINQNISKFNLKINGTKKHISFGYFLNECLNKRFKDEDNVFLISNYERIVKNIYNKNIDLYINRKTNLVDDIEYKSDIKSFTFIVNQMLYSINNILNQKNISPNKTAPNLLLLQEKKPVTEIKENFNAKTLQTRDLNQRPQFNTDNIEKMELLKKEFESLALKLKVIFSIFKRVNNKKLLFYKVISSDFKKRIKIRKVIIKFKEYLTNHKNFKEKLYI